jgi:hypothetical protein
MKDIGKLELDLCKEQLLLVKAKSRRMTIVPNAASGNIISRITDSELFCKNTVILMNRYFKDDPEFLQRHLSSMNDSPEL